MAIYNGFSTVSANSQKKFKLTGKNLIKQDLLNAFHTRRGSRVMQPRVGCIAWELLFEPLTASSQDDLQANLTGIVNNDPRVSLQNIVISAVDNTITATLTLFFVQTNEVDTLEVNFDSASTSSANF